MAESANSVTVVMTVKSHGVAGDKVVTKSFNAVDWEYDNLDRQQLSEIQELAAPMVNGLVNLGKKWGGEKKAGE